MPNDNIVVSLKVPSLAKYGGIVRDAVYGVALRAGLSVEDSEDLRLAIGEAFTNAIQYSYEEERADKHVDIICNTANGQLEVIIKDYGRGFTEEDKPESNKVGIGLGITFMQSLMDDVRIESALGKGTSIYMIKKISPKL
ncbi:MAG: ATP-binding protein [Candidatus Margulisiibacteriota bacterium]|jgi:serine/threonine-protein kinase RsbW